MVLPLIAAPALLWQKRSDLFPSLTRQRPRLAIIPSRRDTLHEEKLTHRQIWVRQMALELRGGRSFGEGMECVAQPSEDVPLDRCTISAPIGRL